MTDLLHPDLYHALVSKHGDRVPDELSVLLRPGWYPIADRLFMALALEYPGVRIRSLAARRGWLHVDYALPTGGQHDWLRHSHFDKWVQRFVTESTMTCEHCGSGRGLHWRAADFRVPGRRFGPEHDRVLCEECSAPFEQRIRADVDAENEMSKHDPLRADERLQ